MKIIRLTGPAHSVFAQLDFIIHKYGNITLSEYNRLTMSEQVSNSKEIGQREAVDFGGN